MNPLDPLVAQAENVARFLADRGVASLLIGAGAMAVHHHVRFTRDLDLGVAVPFKELGTIASDLKNSRWDVDLSEPGADDPLDGVVDINTSAGLIQLINFGGTFPALIRDALASEPQPISPESRLLVVPLTYLIVLKLYAGGRKSELDILELLDRNPNLDRDALLDLCRRYRVRGLPKLLRELQ